jgi:hypothetical protein
VRALTARDDDADDLVAQNDRAPERRQLAVDDVKIRPANRARLDPQEDLTARRHRPLHFSKLDRRARARQHDGPHEAIVRARPRDEKAAA